jgi:hypothetical protein
MMLIFRYPNGFGTPMLAEEKSRKDTVRPPDIETSAVSLVLSAGRHRNFPASVENAIRCQPRVGNAPMVGGEIGARETHNRESLPASEAWKHTISEQGRALLEIPYELEVRISKLNHTVTGTDLDVSCSGQCVKPEPFVCGASCLDIAHRDNEVIERPRRSIHTQTLIPIRSHY